MNKPTRVNHKHRYFIFSAYKWDAGGGGMNNLVCTATTRSQAEKYYKAWAYLDYTTEIWDMEARERVEIPE